jgi:hypothetical protein
MFEVDSISMEFFYSCFAKPGELVWEAEGSDIGKVGSVDLEEAEVAMGL